MVDKWLNLYYNNTVVFFRGVAQLVARLLWEQDAAGSSPVTPTKRRVAADKTLSGLIGSVSFFARRIVLFGRFCRFIGV